MIHWKNTHLDKIEDADSITDDDHILFRQPEKNPLYMSNYNAIATEADFNGPEHTSWRDRAARTSSRKHTSFYGL